MTSIPWLELDEFPDPRSALESPNGLLAAGGVLSPEVLLKAYRSGIFPWYEEGQPLLWWSPDPRTVLRPEHFNLSRSLRKRLRRREFEVRVNHHFAAVIEACAAPRQYATGTWITPEMQQAYVQLHELGHAHSFESYQDGQLVGGLYGVSVGNMFCGESMFQTVTDASKVAFAHLVRFVAETGADMIDCQLENDHLLSLGCESISRDLYLDRLRAASNHTDVNWQSRTLDYNWGVPPNS